MSLKSLTISTKRYVWLFFGIFFLTGLLIFDDYGVSWDEQTSQFNGVVSSLYVAKWLFPDLIHNVSTLQYYPPLHEYRDKDYGVLFEMTTFAIEQVFNLTEVRDVYLMRHLFNFLTFFVAVYFFFRLISERFNNPLFGLLGAFFLVLSPRIFADAFYNSKDLVFLSFFCIGTYTLVKFLKNPTYKTAFWHAVATAFAINIRITGVCLPILTIAVYLINCFTTQHYRPVSKSLKVCLVYLALLAGVILLFWPYLWEAPVANFVTAFKNMSNFRWEGNVKYAGNYVLSTELPWHYFPVWLLVTTPLLYSFLFIAGTIYALYFWIKNFQAAFRAGMVQEDLVFLALFIAPTASVIVLQSVLYDGWRQLYFLYVPFLYLSLVGLAGLWSWLKNKRVQQTIAALVAIQCLHTLVFMVQYHPFQFAYFSFLRGQGIEQNFERDYWGVSIRNGLEHILETDNRNEIRVTAEEPFLVLINNNKLLIKPELLKRLKRVTLSENPDYFITTYRENPFDAHFGEEYYSIKVQGAKILTVFKMK